MMKRFCIECGKEAAPDHNVCIHCGTPLPKVEAFEQQAGKKNQKQTYKADTGAQEVESAEFEDPNESTNDEPPIAETAGESIDDTVDRISGAENDQTLPMISASGTPDEATIKTPGPSQEVTSEGESGETITDEPAEIEQSQVDQPPTPDSTYPAADTTSEAEDVQAAQAQASATYPTEAPQANQNSTAPASRQAKTNKKNKFLWRMIAFIAILLIAFVVWAKNYTSPEAVEKRFQKAIDSKDVSQIQKLVIHGDLTSIEPFEAEAFLELIKTEGRSVVDSLTDTVYAGKFLFIFDTHKIEVTDQIPYSNRTEDLTYTFNGEEVAIFDEEDDRIAYGPLAPGVYEVTANLSNDFGEFTADETVVLASTSYQEYTSMDIDMPVDEVFFYVENADSIDPQHIQVKVNDKEYKVDEHYTTEVVGPMPIDGSLDASVVATMPWGEVESEAQPIEEIEPWLVGEFYTDEHLNDISKFLSDFGEQFVEAQATQSTKPLKHTADEVNDLVTEYFREDYVYTGQLDKVGINEADIYLYTEDEALKITVPVNYTVSEDQYYPDDEPNLGTNEYNFNVELSYDESEKSWHLSQLTNYGMYFEATDEWDGSGKLYGPSDDDIAKAKDQANDGELNAEMEDFLIDYTIASVDAINERDFDLVVDYITKDGPRHDEARDYIDYLDSKDIFETWLGTELESMEEIDKKQWEVTVLESFEIIRPDSSDEWDYRTVLIIEEDDGKFLVDELIETNRIDD